MTDKYLKYIPKTLQEDFIDNRVVPFIGAGFSKNAVVPRDATVLDWDGLGQAIATYIPNYSYTNAIDSLSLFESEYTRSKLIEIMAKELNIHSMKPGTAHKAFCSLNFETICTTNFDFLIEQTLNETSTPFSTIVSEERLPIDIQEKTKVIKIHGDFNHPEHMVITEDDYDCFLDKNKILATYISNIFITKTLLLIGYSFDDYDIRTLWKIIGSRLGKLHSPAYIVLVGAEQIEVSKFERRNIKVINLPGEKKNYNTILESFFKEIKKLITEKAPKKLVFTSEKANEELIMPSGDSNMCYISAPFERIARLKDILYPVLINNGITPVTLDEVIVAGDNWIRKTETLINQSFMAVIDISNNSQNIMWEYENLIAKGKKVIFISDEEFESNILFNNQVHPRLHYSLISDNYDFLNEFENQIKEILLSQNNGNQEKEHIRLLRKGEYNAAVISVFRFLEFTLNKKFKLKGFNTTSTYLRLLNTNNQKDRENLIKTKEYLSIRNQIVHRDVNIKKTEATKIIDCVESLCESINEEKIIIL